MNAQDTSAEPTPDLSLEVAHLLLIDVVGYSKLLVNAQIELQEPASTMPATTLLSQCFFQALLCFRWELCVRDFADFFGELARDFTHIFELLRVALAK